MTTAEELLRSLTGSNDNRVLAIDNDLRTINIPDRITALGVQADDDVHRLQFQMPRHYSGTDLSAFSIRINYMNANHEPDIYLVLDKSFTDSVITFSWLVGPHALLYKGDVNFIVCLKETDTDGNVKREFNTTVATLPVLEGMEVDATSLPAEPLADILAQLGDLKDNKIPEEVTKQIGILQEESATQQTKITETAEKAIGSIDYVRSRANAITKTAEGEVIAVDDASNDYLQNLRIFGKSTQEGTPTPDSPQPIIGIENPTVNIYGKNLWSIDHIELTGGYLNEVLFEGRIRLPAVFSWTQDFARTTGSAMFAYVVDGKTYYMASAEIPGPFQHIMQNGEYLEKITLTNLAPETGNLNNIQLELGDSASNYEPYKSVQPLTLNHILHGIPVSSGGNFTDSDGQQWICDEIDFERGVYVQRVCEEVVNFAAEEDTNGTRYIATISHHTAPAYNGLVMCNKLVYNAHTNPGTNGIRISQYSTNLVIAYFNNTVIDSATVLYPIAVPIETKLTEDELESFTKLHSNCPNMVVMNDADAWTEVKYSADTKTHISDVASSMISVLHIYDDVQSDEVMGDVVLNTYFDMSPKEVYDVMVVNHRPVIVHYSNSKGAVNVFTSCGIDDGTIVFNVNSEDITGECETNEWSTMSGANVIVTKDIPW